MNAGPPPAQLWQLQSVYQNAVSAILGFAGITLFVLLVVGGFKFMTSGGDPKALESAKKTLSYAIGGLILLLVSYLILVFIQNISGAEVTKFKIQK